MHYTLAWEVKKEGTEARESPTLARLESYTGAPTKLSTCRHGRTADLIEIAVTSPNSQSLNRQPNSTVWSFDSSFMFIL